MASNVFVIDASFKRTQVKVTPGKYLREILEEACATRKLNPEAFTLKAQHNKTLDLSQPFRLSGLAAGAKLQLVQASRSPSVVAVALQLPDSEGGGRLAAKFASTTSLWLMLRQYEDGVAGAAQKLNLTQRGAPSSESGAGRLLYEQPCLHVQSRNLDTFTDLQKTLAQLGLSGGSVLMRLSFKPSEQPLEMAMQEISGYFGSVDGVPAGVGSSASPGPPTDATNSSLPEVDAGTVAVPTESDATPAPTPDTPPGTDPTALPPAPPSPSPATTTPPPSNTLNGLTIYLPPTSSTPLAAQTPDDPSLFEPSLDHAKAHQAALLRASRNTRLPSDQELLAKAAARKHLLEGVRSVVVRIRYPDGSIIETVVGAESTSAQLYATVAGTLEAGGEAFELRVLGGKGMETLTRGDGWRLVRDAGFRGKVLVTLVWAGEVGEAARRGPSLRGELRARGAELRVEVGVQREEEEGAGKEVAVGEPEAKKESHHGKSTEGREERLRRIMGFGRK
ncbi:hypothetical protein LTR08_007908 [Meristemomyces frigidus]|nr:hypothetical protein LTR08_007908 [Meristemomyces frigidus]